MKKTRLQAYFLLRLDSLWTCICMAGGAKNELPAKIDALMHNVKLSHYFLFRILSKESIFFSRAGPRSLSARSTSRPPPSAPPPPPSPCMTTGTSGSTRGQRHRLHRRRPYPHLPLDSRSRSARPTLSTGRTSGGRLMPMSSRRDQYCLFVLWFMLNIAQDYTLLKNKLFLFMLQSAMHFTSTRKQMRHQIIYSSLMNS